MTLRNDSRISYGPKHNHLLGWEKVCKPKEEGGWGLGEGRHTCLFGEDGAESYSFGLLMVDASERKKRGSEKVAKTGSATWRAMNKMETWMKKGGTQWIVATGDKMSLWNESWLSYTPMAERFNCEPRDKVSSIISFDSAWIMKEDWPDHIKLALLQTRNIQLQRVEEGDLMVWRKEPQGILTVQMGHGERKRKDSSLA